MESTNKGKVEYREMLASSSLFGLASVLNVFVGLIRAKIVAVMLGPAGVGLISLYTGIVTAGASISTMGVGVSGTRNIATSINENDSRKTMASWRALRWGVFVLALCGAITIFFSRNILAEILLGGQKGNLVGWLAIGVALSVCGVSQVSILQGMRYIKYVVRLNVYGILLSSGIGIFFLATFGDAGIIPYVLTTPFVSFCLGHIYVSRLPTAKGMRVKCSEALHQWKGILKLGVSFMGAGAVSALAQLWIRVNVGNNLGADAIGHFSAASTISMHYTGVVLAVLGADFYPRITGVIQDRVTFVRLINKQTEIALLISAPALVFMMALAPWILRVLYSSEFLPSASVLRWQVFGDVLKIATAPLAYAVLAKGDGKAYFWIETIPIIVMALIVAAFVDSAGLDITGIAFSICYVVYLFLALARTRKDFQFRWSGETLLLLVCVVVICFGVCVLSLLASWGVFVGSGFAIGLAAFAIGRLAHMSEFDGVVGKIGRVHRKLVGLFNIKS